MVWKWVHFQQILIFGWTIPLKSSKNQQYFTTTGKQTEFQLSCEGKHYTSLLLVYSSTIALLLYLNELSLAEDIQDQKILIL